MTQRTEKLTSRLSELITEGEPLADEKAQKAESEQWLYSCVYVVKEISGESGTHYERLKNIADADPMSKTTQAKVSKILPILKSLQAEIAKGTITLASDGNAPLPMARG